LKDEIQEFVITHSDENPSNDNLKANQKLIQYPNISEIFIKEWELTKKQLLLELD